MEKMSGYIELGQTHSQEQGGAVGALHHLPGPLGAGEGGVELQILVVDVQPAVSTAVYRPAEERERTCS